MSHLQVVQVSVAIALIFLALILTLGYLFPSMRGSGWTGQELQLALVFAVLAIAVRLL